MNSEGANLIEVERCRQVEREGFSLEHDDSHDRGELIEAATAYIMAAIKCERHERYMNKQPPKQWPWDDSDWKPSDDTIRNLTKAGALLAAEIDRLLRQQTASSTP